MTMPTWPGTPVTSPIDARRRSAADTSIEQYSVTHDDVIANKFLVNGDVSIDQRDATVWAGLSPYGEAIDAVNVHRRECKFHGLA